MSGTFRNNGDSSSRRKDTTNHHHHHPDTTSSRHYRINYHLLSQSKVRQQHLLRCYVRTNNMYRIHDYYTSIHHYYYQSQLRLERTQQQRIPSPRSRRRRTRGRQRRNPDHGSSAAKEDDDDDENSIHIMIDYDGGGGGGVHSDDNDDSSCIYEDETTVNVLLSAAATTVPVSPRHRPPPHPHARPTSDRVTWMERYHPHDQARYHDVLTSPTNPWPTVVAASPVYTMLDIDASINPNETLHWTILYYACFHHRYQIAQYLIEDCYASLKCTDRYQNTILHWICHYSLPPPRSSTTNDGTPSVPDHATATAPVAAHRTENDAPPDRDPTATKRPWQRFVHYCRRRPQWSHARTNGSSSSSSVEEVQLLLHYIMACAPSLLLVANHHHELPLHWLCQYGNDNLTLIQCMIQFVHTNPYFTSTTDSNISVPSNPHTAAAAASNSPTAVRTTITTTRSSLSQILSHEDQYHRTPIDVARCYQNDRMADYLESLLLLE